MIVELKSVKEFLRIDDDSIENDIVISSLIDEVHRQIEKKCNCIFLPKGSEMPSDGKRYFIIESNVELAIKIMVRELFDGRGEGALSNYVEDILFYYKEHSIG